MYHGPKIPTAVGSETACVELSRILQRKSHIWQERHALVASSDLAAVACLSSGLRSGLRSGSSLHMVIHWGAAGADEPDVIFSKSKLLGGAGLCLGRLGLQNADWKRRGADLQHRSSLNKSKH